ncbi:rod shape-determining protein RodA [Patescibacteria group bacterium]
MSFFSKTHIDWILFLSTLPLIGAGLITMYSFGGESSFFGRQIIWALVSIGAFFACSFIDFGFLKRTDVLVTLFLGSVALLITVLLAGSTIKGAQSWISLGPFSFQPADPVKLVIILVLAKYFSRRHIEIANIRHILVSAFYALVPFALVLLQPDFGSALIIFTIWFGMVMVSGISKKHLLLVLTAGIIAFSLLWSFGFTGNQKQRILTFLHPLADIQGAGYNAFQSTIAVGSGGVLGKGIGYGTQSRLEFLPEYETDFIFAAFAEEWGFVGTIIFLAFFGVLLWRILSNAIHGSGNFEMFYGVGIAVFIVSHIVIHVGMNIGMMPVTGLPLPFVSYGGSHLLTEFIGLGILMSMRRYERTTHRDNINREFLGI